MSITLCLNCLETGAIPVRVGPQKGTQFDPYYDEVYLCGVCKTALLSGDFTALAYRHTDHRTITVGAQGER